MYVLWHYEKNNDDPEIPKVNKRRVPNKVRSGEKIPEINKRRVYVYSEGWSRQHFFHLF